MKTAFYKCCLESFLAFSPRSWNYIFVRFLQTSQALQRSSSLNPPSKHKTHSSFTLYRLDPDPFSESIHTHIQPPSFPHVLIVQEQLLSWRGQPYRAFCKDAEDSVHRLRMLSRARRHGNNQCLLGQTRKQSIVCEFVTVMLSHLLRASF